MPATLHTISRQPAAWSRRPDPAPSRFRNQRERYNRHKAQRWLAMHGGAALATDLGGLRMEPLVLTADWLFDGVSAWPLLRPLVRVADGQVQAVDRQLLTPATCSGQRFDFPGCTLLPGLIDTHVHLVFSAADT